MMTIVAHESGRNETQHLRRIGGSPAADPFTGEWEHFDPVEVRYESVEGGLRVASPTGTETYAAKFNGTDVPFKGDERYDRVRLVRLDGDTFYEIKKKSGRTVDVLRASVSPDGKQLRHEIINANTGQGRVLISERVP